MISQRDADQLISSLLTRTRAKEIPWREHDDPLTGEGIRLDLDRSSVRLSVINVGDMWFRILNERGQPVYSETTAPFDPRYAPLDELFNLAIRQSRLVDETLEDLRSFLDKRPNPPK